MAHPTAPEVQEGVDSPRWFCRVPISFGYKRFPPHCRHGPPIPDAQRELPLLAVQGQAPHVARDAPRGGGESSYPEAATPPRLDYTDTPPSASFRHLWIMNEYRTQPDTDF